MVWDLLYTIYFFPNSFFLLQIYTLTILCYKCIFPIKNKIFVQQSKRTLHLGLSVLMCFYFVFNRVINFSFTV